jgi:hypothetical protein
MRICLVVTAFHFFVLSCALFERPSSLLTKYNEGSIDAIHEGFPSTLNGESSNPPIRHP